jgi:hypothetical protein
MFKPGDTVKIKRDIFRWEEIRHKLIRYDSEAYQNSDPERRAEIICRNDIVRQNRQQVLYAKEGEVGRVTDIFASDSWTWNAKVLIDGEIKTFRLTSLEKSND